MAAREYVVYYYYHTWVYNKWILSLYIWKENWFFFLPCLYYKSKGKCPWDIQTIMCTEIRISPKDEKKCGEASHSICKSVSALYPTKIDYCRHLNSDIWKWVVTIICGISTKQKKWSTPGRYTICRSHSRKKNQKHTFSQSTIKHSYLNFRCSDLLSFKQSSKGFCQGSEFEPDKRSPAPG